MSLYGAKTTLIEQKKLQWAKEREELANLTVPWGKTYTKFNKNCLRTNVPQSKFSNSEISLNRDETTYPPVRNLPPLEHRNHRNYERYELEGETSGYASDSAKEGTPDQQQQQPPPQIWSQWNHRLSESEISSGRDERPRWGDRGGYAGGHMWQPHDKTVEPPGWVQRGLKNDKEILIISNSPDRTTESSERPFTGDSTQTNMNLIKTHLRGHNIPLEPAEVAERELKRQKALQLQTAIRQQVEERETKRKQERERKLREEAEEELRIRREQELERQRVEEEQKLLAEKKEREKQRLKQMQEAVENAERQAILERKQKQMRLRTNVLNLPEEVDESNLKKNEELKIVNNSPRVVPEPNSTPRVQTQTVTKVEEKEKENKNKNENETKQSNKEQNEVSNDNITVVLQNPFDFQGLHLALLMPTMNTLPVTIPVAVSNETNPTISTITENRVLTPSIYRLKKNLRDMSTQTDLPEIKRDEKPSSLDRSCNNSVNEKRERRFRSEERTGNKERPKWGVNQPPTRYMKQSEKDPVYQKRKLRQKVREDKNNNYSQSSDDSVPDTPDRVSYRKQNYNRNVWHRNERTYSQNISVYQTEVVPLETDKRGRYYIKDRTDFREITSERSSRIRKCRDSTPEPFAFERLTSRCESRKERLNEQNERRRKFSDGGGDDILDKLDSLRHGLLMKQKQWDDDDDDVCGNSGIEFPDVHEKP